MAASHTFSLDPRFPVGTVLSVYRDNWLTVDPGGTPVTTATVQANRTATATGLSYDTPYTAGATVNGSWRAVVFRTESDPGLEPATAAELDAVESGLAQRGFNVRNAIGILSGATGDGAADDTAVIAAHIEAARVEQHGNALGSFV